MRFYSILRPSVAKLALGLVLAVVAVQPGWCDITGSIFLTGHDPDFHASQGGNGAGAVNLIDRAMAFVTDPAFNPFTGLGKFLYVEGSTTPPPGFNVEGDAGLAAAGFVEGINYDEADASTLVAALAGLGTKYDAIVIASDFGANLTEAELSILDSNSALIIGFLNKGGGLFAMAESGFTNKTVGQFGFLPFIVSSAQKNQSEVGNTLTPFGASLGLLTSDINGNASHNVFTSAGGLNIVDNDSSGQILSLAGRGQVTSGGLAPEPGTMILVGTGLLTLAARRRRKTT